MAEGPVLDLIEVDAPLSDDELVALALTADSDAEVGPDAVCLWDLLGPGSGAPTGLPEWYMPTSRAGRLSGGPGWSRRLALLVVVSLLLIDACGLCVTYGALVWA